MIRSFYTTDMIMPQFCIFLMESTVRLVPLLRNMKENKVTIAFKWLKNISPKKLIVVVVADYIISLT